MKFCPYCKKETKPSAHIYSCAKKHNIEKNNTEIKFEYIQYNYPELCNITEFKHKYEVELYSIPDFTKEFNTDNKTILFLLEYFKLHKRSISESSKLISTSKYKKTCMRKYGVDNVSKSNDIKEKKKKTFISNYGVDNIFKEEKFKKYIAENNFAWMYEESNKKRSVSQTKSIRYFWENVSDERREEILKIKKESNKKYWENLSISDRINRMKNLRPRVSKLETRIANIMIMNNIGFSSQVFINNRSYDFKFSNTRILLEVQGDYWHGNPDIYLYSDMIKMPGKGLISVMDLWQNDEDKRNSANECGYGVVYLWEKDIKKLTDEEIYEKLIVYLQDENKKNN